MCRLRFVLQLFVVSVTFAQSTNSPPDPRRLFESAVRLQVEAHRSCDTANAVSLLEQAIRLYDEALKAQPDFQDGWQARGQCRYRLAAVTVAPDLRRQHLNAALRDFTAATQLPDADWQAHRSRADLLVMQFQFLSDSPAEAQGLLEEARASFLRAIMAAKYKSRHDQTEAELAACLTKLAKLTSDPAAQRTLWEEATQRFERSGGELMVNSNPRLMSLWGVSLTELGKLTRDKAKYHQAIAILTATLELAPDDLMSRYNLACQYALLGQLTDALHQLSDCLNDSRQGKSFRSAAEKDPDLGAVCRTAGYAKLIQTAAANPKDTPATLRARGEALLHEAQANPSAADSFLKLQAAALIFEQLVTLQPGVAKPLVLQATAEQFLAAQTTDPNQRRALVESARRHLVAAAACPDGTPGLGLQRAKLILNNLDTLAHFPAERNQLLQEAQRDLEAELQTTPTAGEQRAAIECALGMLFNQLAQQESVTRDQRARFYTRAVTHLEAGLQNPGEVKRASNSYQLGIALLRLFQLDQDKLKAHRAIERLDIALQLSPGDSNVQYTLVQACALAGRPRQAVRHLQACLENDPGNAIRQRALTDRELDSLRMVPEFIALYPNPEPARITPATPRITDR